MTREEAIYELERMKTWSKDLSDDEIEAIAIALKELEQKPKEITFDDVQKYCRARCLTIITDELLFELTHQKLLK